MSRSAAAKRPSASFSMTRLATMSWAAAGAAAANPALKPKPRRPRRSTRMLASPSRPPPRRDELFSLFAANASVRALGFQRDGELLAAALDDDLPHARRRADRASQIAGGADRAAVHLADDVAGAQAHLLRRARAGLQDHDALLAERIDADLLGHRRRQVDH